MERDIRGTDLYREVKDLLGQIRRPGSGKVSEVSEVHVAPNGREAVFAGVVLDSLEGGTPATRICRADLVAGTVSVLTPGPDNSRTPKYSPDGAHVAFLSDRRSAGDFQLYLLDLATGAVRPTPAVSGWVEYFHWSPDGKRVLLGVAGHGADVAGGQGAVTSKQLAQDVPTWVPSVDTGEEEFRWRRVWLYNCADDSVRQIDAGGLNIWEAVWCGTQMLAAIASPSPDEGSWYTARLYTIQLQTGERRELYAPRSQLGGLAASARGAHVAVIEAVSSDRGIVAGDLRVIQVDSREVRRIDTRAIDISHLEWRSDTRLLGAGHRGFEIAVGLYDVAADSFDEVWCSSEVTGGARYVSVSGIGLNGDCVLTGESFLRSPELALIRGGRYHCIHSFDLGYAELAQAIGSVEQVTWEAPDGLHIQGSLICPRVPGSLPLIMQIHGGPIGSARPTWLGRGGAPALMWIRHGYAVFYPNPRGSSGRGQDFAGRVIGDMGGADAQDLLSGVDHLIHRGIVDSRRVGVTGVSYGGFMTAWLVTQDPRFAAAVAVAPITNWVTEHTLSNIPSWVQSFLADDYRNTTGAYFRRSPLMHAHNVRTPTLLICGSLDRCTPPAEAMQFYRALRENGSESVLVTYPEEGHGVRRFPATIDYSARALGWFNRHLQRSNA